MKIKYPTRDELYTTLTQRVDAYFANTGKEQYGDWRLFTKTGILFVLTALAYTGVILTPISWISSFFYGVMMGILFALIGFNVMHDGAHGSYSKKKWVNTLMAHTATLMGASAHMWQIKHNVIHHSMTNTEADDDLNAGPLFRMHPTQTKKCWHKAQYIYAIPAYGLLFFVWVWWNDFRKYFAKKIHTTTIKNLSPREHALFWGGKLFHFITMIYIPISILGVSHGLFFYGAFLLVCGFFLSIVFQLAHVVGKTIFPTIDTPPNKITKESWAANQIRSTCNFATGNRRVRWFTGGLNYQIEHHLFPKISHIHYPAIQAIIKKTCEEYLLPYNEYEHVTEAIESHLVTLKKLGS